MLPHRRQPTDTESEPTLITATGLGVDGEHGPLFSDIDLALTSGFHAIQMPGGPGQTALLLTLAGRLKASHGTVTVLGDTQPRAIRRHCSIAAFDEIDELEESVTVADRARRAAPLAGAVVLAGADRGRAGRTGQGFRRDAPAVGRSHTSSSYPIWSCSCCASRWRCFPTVRSWWSVTSSRSVTTLGGRSRSNGSARSRRSAPSLSG